MFKLTKKVFIVLLNCSRSLTSIVKASEHRKCISFNNEQCMT